MAKGATLIRREPNSGSQGSNVNKKATNNLAAHGGAVRSNKLRDLLEKVLAGSQLVTPGNARLFLEAVCDQADPQGSILRLIASEHGFPALQAALQVEPSVAFLNGPVTKLLQYLQAPAIKNICAGDVLRQIISKFVDPPLVWNSFLATVRQKNVTEDGLDAFSWLLLQLVSVPTEQARPYASVIGEDQIRAVLLESPRADVRSRTHRIIHIAETIKTPGYLDADGPGGRHDNDFADIRKIRILPTADELTAKEPFLRRAVDLEDAPKHDLALHIDNQFRLLREDLIRELREEIDLTLSSKRHGRRSLVIDNVSLAGVLCDGQQPWALQLRCNEDLPHFPSSDQELRLEYLEENPKFVRHQSVACLLAEHEVVGLATIVGDAKLLAQCPPVICLKLTETAMETTLPRLRAAKVNRLVVLGTAVFSYEPILRQLKEIKEIALEDEVLHWEPGSELPMLSTRFSGKLQGTLRDLEKDYSLDLKKTLDYPNPVHLDKSQAECFLAGLRQRLTLVQGPPGTGKSFLGALIAKAIHRFTEQTILVVCQTHHALDQFLEELLDAGIPAHDIVRLGAVMKAPPRTAHLALSRLQSNEHSKSDHFQRTKRLKAVLKVEGNHLSNAFESFREAIVTKGDIMEYLEFLMDGPPFAEAFKMPDDNIRNMRLGRRGNTMNEHYLLDRWYRGKDAGIYKNDAERYYWDVWGIRSQERLEMFDSWKTDILKDRVTAMREAGLKYNALLQQLEAIHMEKDQKIIQSKRIIGCTTSAAAKYVELIQSVSPDVLLVEEAGEILESHVLTALGPETKQMILIGDHKQLRPKVHWDLSVEKGEGYDLNRSLFERLVLKGYPHHVLSQQHRMRPEISALARQLTYPDLVDAPKTQDRPDLKGFQDNLIFVNHAEAEYELGEGHEWNEDPSKKNMFEATMVLKCVRYLGQQGYRTDNIVVLTPYLGQLRLLWDELGKENDPVLNDLDNHDLVRTGLIPAASADVNKPPIRIATIDNYQGEESDIVIVSLTRSNKRQDIGFMSSPERLNVMLSRARNALIMIGNAETFLGSWKGGEIWERFIELLKAGKHVYDGFPVKCEQHETRKATLGRPEDFDEHCPDGGCPEPCNVKLKCGNHKCPRRCHRDVNHSQMDCEYVMMSTCKEGHEQSWKCHENLKGMCRYCARQDEATQRNLVQQLQRQMEVDSQQVEHDAAIAELDREIQRIEDRKANRRAADERSQALQQKQRYLESVRHGSKVDSGPNCKPQQYDATIAEPDHGSQRVDDRKVNRRLSEERPQVLRQKQRYLEKVRLGAKANSGQIFKPVQEDSPASHEFDTLDTPSSNAESEPEWQNVGRAGDRALVGSARSPAQQDWEGQKRRGQEHNEALDSLMGLTGLEDVKMKILYIKKRIEKLVDKGLDLNQEPFGLTMNGNPGTGNQTVARLYTSFLKSMDALPATKLVSLNGHGLIWDGIKRVQESIDVILKAGGGALFLDDAYVLVEEFNAKGIDVLDLLLKQAKNLAGKVVFILAAYDTDIQKILDVRPALEYALPHRLYFHDYTDQEMLEVLGGLVRRHGKRLQGGIQGQHTKVVIKRLGRYRWHQGFTNAVAIKSVWIKILERQTTRISRERGQGFSVDETLLTKDDIIGPEPKYVVSQCAAWKELHNATGRQAVKDSMSAFVDHVQSHNYEQDLADQPSNITIMNRVFQGSSTVGMVNTSKHFAAILTELGLLASHELVNKTALDLVGRTVKDTVLTTKKLLGSSKGKMVVIHDAHKLCGFGKTGIEREHQSAIIRALVDQLRRTAISDQCVVLLGADKRLYDQLSSHQGFSDVFPTDSAIFFEDVDDDSLAEILEALLKQASVNATDEAKEAAVEILGRARGEANFGSATSVRKLIAKAKVCNYQTRNAEAPSERPPMIVLTSEDFGQAKPRAELKPQKPSFQTQVLHQGKCPPRVRPAKGKAGLAAPAWSQPTPEPKAGKFDIDFSSASTKASRAQKLMSDFVGREAITRKMESYRILADALRDRGLDTKTQIPYCFVFKGPSGTGKKTVAQRFAALFHESGLLRTKELIEQNVSKLLNMESAITDLSVVQAVTEAAGKVLLIKNAHELGSSPSSEEALDALTRTLTWEPLNGKPVVILSGPADGLNKLLSSKLVLSKSFTEEIIFNALTPEECAILLHRQVKAAGIGLRYLKGAPTPSSILDRFQKLSQLPTWANGREVKALAKSIIDSAFGGAESLGTSLTISESKVIAAMDDWYEDMSRLQAVKPTEEASVAAKSPKDIWVNVEVRVEDVDVDAPTAAGSPDPERSASLPTSDGSSTPATTPEGQLESTGLANALVEAKSGSDGPWQLATGARRKKSWSRTGKVNGDDNQAGTSSTADEVEALVNNLQGMKLG